MMTKTFDKTTVFICESTAHCAVQYPMLELTSYLTDWIYKNNYVCDVLLGDTKSTTILSQHVGGETTSDPSRFKQFVDQYA